MTKGHFCFFTPPVKIAVTYRFCGSFVRRGKGFARFAATSLAACRGGASAGKKTANHSDLTFF